MQPIWFCIVQTDMLSTNGIHAYRIIKAVKSTLDQLDSLYKEHGNIWYEIPRAQTMLFFREPDELPLVETEIK